jgi:hypothetical protein
VRGQKLICLEFNELCPELLVKWMQGGQLPNFRKFFEQSQILTAVADEPGPENLEPWIQWYSLHTGLRYAQHGVQNLTDGPTATHPDVWKILAEEGLRVASCGSMNAKAVRSPGALYVPDPWCTNQTTYPPEWNAYHDLVSGMVQESSRADRSPLGKAHYLSFLKFVTTHGLSAKTVWRLVSQIFSDTVMRRGTGWKRAALLDKVQFDVFRWYWKRNRPDFASFFLNSTAHYQHAYWHCTFPEQFDEAPKPEEVQRFGAAILYGYQQMDELLGSFFALEEQGALLMLCTALSQQSIGRTNQVLYRIREVDQVLSQLQLPAVEILPVMSEQFNVRFQDAAQANRAKELLQALHVGTQPLLFFGKSDETSLFLGSAARTAIDDDARVTGFPDGRTMRFGDIFYRLPTIKATTHHPESLMWLKTGSHRVHREKVSILDWLPTILDFYGVKNLSGANDRAGRSFLPQLQS